ncbi:MAG: hypothetical protein U0835_06045 [Isosphaeraceae bacterium]
MPNSTTKTGNAGLYVPGATGATAMREEESPIEAFVERGVASLEDYARREPLTFAAWVFGVGFVLGWKLKPW